MIIDNSASQNKKSPPERTGRRVHPFPIYGVIRVLVMRFPCYILNKWICDFLLMYF